MLYLIGTISLGLVWGWLLLRLLPGRGWAVITRVVAGLAAQAALVWQLVAPIGVVWFGIGVLLGMTIVSLWLRRIAAR